MARYRKETAVDGRWSRQVQPVMRDVQPYKMSCCDCGLVHDIEFWIEDDHVQMRVARNNRATGQVRRHMRKT
jgi:hypothetical protein